MYLAAILEKNILVLKNSGQLEKSVVTHAALAPTLTTATEIFQIRAHLNAQNTHFLATYFFRMTLKKTKSALTSRRVHSATRQNRERWRPENLVGWSCRERHPLDKFGTIRPDTTWT